ncbi:MAG: hypothetical protein MHM6MM_004901 [Cercozoa sp. M6MM]
MPPHVLSSSPSPLTFAQSSEFSGVEVGLLSPDSSHGFSWSLDEDHTDAVMSRAHNLALLSPSSTSSEPSSQMRWQQSSRLSDSFAHDSPAHGFGTLTSPEFHQRKSFLFVNCKKHDADHVGILENVPQHVETEATRGTLPQVPHVHLSRSRDEDDDYLLEEEYEECQLARFAIDNDDDFDDDFLEETKNFCPDADIKMSATGMMDRTRKSTRKRPKRPPKRAAAKAARLLSSASAKETAKKLKPPNAKKRRNQPKSKSNKSKKAPEVGRHSVAHREQIDPLATTLDDLESLESTISTVRPSRSKKPASSKFLDLRISIGAEGAPPVVAAGTTLKQRHCEHLDSPTCSAKPRKDRDRTHGHGISYIEPECEQPAAKRRRHSAPSLLAPLSALKPPTTCIAPPFHLVRAVLPGTTNTSSTPPVAFSCIACRKAFASAEALAHHVVTLHVGCDGTPLFSHRNDGRCVCPVCASTFKSRHLALTHFHVHLAPLAASHLQKQKQQQVQKQRSQLSQQAKSYLQTQRRMSMSSSMQLQRAVPLERANTNPTPSRLARCIFCQATFPAAECIQHSQRCELYV